MDFEKDLLDEDHESSALGLTTTSAGYLTEISKWTLFLSIIGFIGLGIMLLVALGLQSSRLPNMQREEANAMTTLFVILSVVYFFPIYYMYKFSVEIKSAVIVKSKIQLEQGLKYLKTHFKYVGIFTIVILSLYALIILFALIGMGRF